MSIQIQQQIKNNAQDLRNYIDDLYSWEETVKFKKKNEQPAQSKYVPPVRGQVEISTQNKTSIAKQLKRDANSIQDYYKSWSQFDIVTKKIKNKNIKDQELEQDKEEIFQPQFNLKPQNQAQESSKIVIKGGRKQIQASERVIQLKENGNLQYKLRDFTLAIKLYSEAIDILQQQQTLNQEEQELLVILYSNRAQVEITQQDYIVAERDCTNALKIDSKHVKSLQRRGTIYQKLGKLKLALVDFSNAALIDISFKQIQADIEQKLKSQKIKARENLKIKSNNVNFQNLIPIKVQDISIKEIQQQTQDSNSKQKLNTNNLEEQIQSNNEISSNTRVRFGETHFTKIITNANQINKKSCLKKDLKYLKNEDQQSKKPYKQIDSYDYKSLKQEKIDGNLVIADENFKTYIQSLQEKELQQV